MPLGAFTKQASSHPYRQIPVNRCVSPANTNGIFIDYIAKFVYSLVIKLGGVFMPTIRSSADLMNHYNEISTFVIIIMNRFSLRKMGRLILLS